MELHAALNQASLPADAVLRPAAAPARSPRPAHHKFSQRNLFAHHTASGTPGLVNEVARLPFVHDIEIRRHISGRVGYVASGKEIGQLTVFCPSGGSGNVLRVQTTARDVAQHLYTLAALAEALGVPARGLS